VVVTVLLHGRRRGPTARWCAGAAVRRCAGAPVHVGGRGGGTVSRGGCVGV